jgi:hypothetical protein
MRNKTLLFLGFSVWICTGKYKRCALPGIASKSQVRATKYIKNIFSATGGNSATEQVNYIIRFPFLNLNCDVDHY